MRDIVWTRPAVEDLVAIHRFIAGDNRAAADRVQDRVTDRVEQLRQYPLSGRAGRVQGTRELAVARVISRKAETAFLVNIALTS